VEKNGSGAICLRRDTIRMAKPVVLWRTDSITGEVEAHQAFHTRIDRQIASAK